MARQVAQDCLDVAFEDCIKPTRDDPTAIGTREMADAIITAPDSIVPAQLLPGSS